MKYHLIIISLTALLGLTGCINPFSPSFSVGPKIKKSHKKVLLNKRIMLQKVPQVSYQEASEKKYAMFQKKMRQVAKSTLENQQYDKMTLGTKEKKEWFTNLMYQLWDRQITRREFIQEGLQKYPTHQYEFEFIANGFQN